MNDLAKKILQDKNEKGCNDFLDDMLDGKPVHIVDSPGLRRALRRRAIERSVEESQWIREALRRKAR